MIQVDVMPCISLRAFCFSGFLIAAGQKNALCCHRLRKHELEILNFYILNMKTILKVKILLYRLSHK